MSRLLDQALPLDVAGRRAWLHGLAPEYQELADALRQALLPNDSLPTGLDRLATLPKLGSIDEACAADASDLQAGARVGPYELIRPLGAGGMAQVWLARRADGAFRRELALKLPIVRHPRADLERRFARERDILASLEHPHIARFYDAGVDPRGLSYLALEYVHGQALTDYSAAKQLGIAMRLRLFLQVLDAVQYAHAKHVIHRDLKPSNILVNESGEVQLLDFGVAKLLEAKEVDRTQLTSVYGRALTPDYASPELLRGEAIDARSDVYSLGVVLYELLTGVRPYRLEKAASIGLLREAITRVESKKPSTQAESMAFAARATTLQRFARQLRGDIDAIALKALAKEPAERYPSATSLAEDLQRYLDGKPVRALPARLPDRLHKFVRRNGAVVGVGVFAIAGIVAMGGYALYRDMAARARIANQGAASAATRAESVPAANLTPLATSIVPPARSVAVLPFVDMSENHDQGYFSDGLSEELIDLLSQVPDLRVPARTSSFFFKEKPTTIAQIAGALSVAHVLEGSVRKAGKRLRVTAQLIRADNGYHLWSQSYDRDDSDIFAVQDEIARSVVNALQVKLAAQPQETGARRTANPEAHTQYLLGRQLFRRGGLGANRLAVEAYRKAIALDPTYAAAYAELAVSEGALADLTGEREWIERAEHDVDTAIAIAPADASGYAARSLLRRTFLWDWSGSQADIEKALLMDPASSDVQRRYARLLESLGRLPEAIVAQKKAAELDPLSINAWANLGSFFIKAGDYASADAALARAIEIEPNSTNGLFDLGELRLLQGRAQEALETFRKIDAPVYRLPGIVAAQHTLGHAKESQQALEEMLNHSVWAYQIAESFAWRGEKDRAFEWLDRAYTLRDGGLASIKIDPLLRSLHADRRFNTLLRKLNLPE